MTTTFYNFIKSTTSTKAVIIGLLLIILFNIVFLPLLPELLWNYKLPIEKILDLKFSYTTAMVYNLFDEIGIVGRRAYTFLTLLIDVPYALIYSITYTMIIYLLLNFNQLIKYRFLILIPILIGTFDILENLGIATMLTNYPNRLEKMAILTSLFTSLKWIFAGLTLLIIIYNILKYIGLKAMRKL